MEALVKHALDIAVDENGVRERGLTNTGLKVNAYLASVGTNPGNPWCAAFVYWCIQHAADGFGIKPPYVRSAYTPDIDRWALDHDIRFDGPVPGDTFLLYGVTGGVFRAHHTGFVLDVNGDGTFKTIEGNTNDDGSRDGYGVFVRTRSVNANTKFVRWGSLLAPTLPTFKVMVGGAEFTDVRVVDGRVLCGMRAWAKKMGFAVGFEDGVVTFDGQPVTAEVTIFGDSAYAPVRQLAESAGLKVDFEPATQTVTVAKA